MKLALTSDIHRAFLGLKDKRISKLAKELAKGKPDIILSLGDHCGSFHGARDTRVVLRTLREENPDVPILACLGNHDYWQAQPSLKAWREAQESYRETASEFSVHLFEEHGSFRSPKFPGFVAVGHGLWYKTSQLETDTNDAARLPVGVNGDTWRTLQLQGYKSTVLQLGDLTEEDTLRVFCSHFPLSLAFSRDPLEGLGFRAAFCGHLHSRVEGPFEHRCGSDYGSPKFMEVTL